METRWFEERTIVMTYWKIVAVSLSIVGVGLIVIMYLNTIEYDAILPTCDLGQVCTDEHLELSVPRKQGKVVSVNAGESVEIHLALGLNKKKWRPFRKKQFDFAPFPPSHQNLSTPKVRFDIVCSDRSGKGLVVVKSQSCSIKRKSDFTAEWSENVRMPMRAGRYYLLTKLIQKDPSKLRNLPTFLLDVREIHVQR